MDLLNPPVQGGAFDDFLATAAPASRTQPHWPEADGPLPALYLGHGAPPLFNDPLCAGLRLRRLRRPVLRHDLPHSGRR